MNSRKMCQTVLLWFTVLLAAAFTSHSLASEPVIIQVTLPDQAITPVTARFIKRTLDQAQVDNIECYILELDTPGGLMTSTHQIVKDILNSPIPVVVYVSPSGGRAASAGVFITLASHVAAMAPGTHIGAAHPVQIGMPLGSQPEQAPTDSNNLSPLEEKVLSDASAWARSLAQMRGRNAEWAVAAVSQSKSLTASEAVEENVVELLAVNLDELLEKLDGRMVKINDRTVTLQTKQATVQTISMWWGETALSMLANPNIAFLLLIFGFYGIFFELYTPGWGVPGTLGAICLMLGCFALSLLPVNITGLLLVIAALALFVAEAFVTSYGALTLGGVVCLVFGGLMLIDTPVRMMRISLGLLIPVALATAAITVFLIVNIVKGHRRRVQTGTEGMIGQEAAATEDFVQQADKYTGMVWFHGEYWKAQSEQPVFAGDIVELKSRHGLILDVVRSDQSSNTEEQS